jgi:hypothetical protein
MFDLNNAQAQRGSDLIPANTVAALQMTIRRGDTGDGLWLTTSKDGRSVGLDCEFTIIDGEYKGRKLWSRFTLDGPSDGHKQAGDITLGMVRAILESARGVKPDDTSEAAKAARIMSEWGDLDGMSFIGRIGVQPAQDQYAAKNTLLEVITPDRKHWRLIEQLSPQRSSAAAHSAAAPPPAAEIVRPAWAR